MARLDARQRAAAILAALQRNAAIRVAELAAELDVTTETIRRDLARLGDSGRLWRTYGGAVIRPPEAEPMAAERAGLRVPERRRIAARAAVIASTELVMMIDAGSTTALFAQALAPLAPAGLMVVTNAFEVAAALGANPGVHVVMCPGDYTPREGGVTGAETVAFLARFRPSLAVIGASGLTADGVEDANGAAASVKRAMLRQAGRAMLLADASKFGRRATELVCPLASVSDLVTDAAPPDALATMLARADVAVHVAAPERGRAGREREAG